MHPNPSSSIHAFQVPPVISKTHISSATSDLVFIGIGMSLHADVNVVLAHTDVEVRAAGGVHGRESGWEPLPPKKPVRTVAAAAGGLAPCG